MDVSGKYLYAAVSNSIQTFNINSTTGILTAGSSTTTDYAHIINEQSGKCIFGYNGGNSYQIGVYSIAEGVLTAISGSPFSNGTSRGYSVAVDPTTSVLYSSAGTTGLIGMNISSSSGSLGTLSVMSLSPFASGTNELSQSLIISVPSK